jgi:hypothetical protein
VDFSKASLAIEWSHCTDPERRDGGKEICEDSEDPRSFYLTIRRDAAQGSAKSSLGFAFPKFGLGNHAAVLYAPVVEQARTYAGCVAPQVLLAHAIAHELGHLLTGSVDHGETIMKGSWGEVDFRMMSQPRFLFTEGQREQFRTGLMLRVARYQHGSGHLETTAKLR